tara:strand:- start:3847 stop:4494 length:648 start_codon:yes stop_codon:yes gene_type:complete
VYLNIGCLVKLGMMIIFKWFNIVLLVFLLMFCQSCKEQEIDSSILEKETNSVVKIVTNKGNIFVELYNQEAPITVTNFLNYVKSDFYDNTIFHRVIDGFMIQGGGFLADMTLKKVGNSIKNEAINGLSNKLGTIAMARTQIVDSATSQFFINVNDNTFLDHQSINPQQYGYAVFGNVIQGMSVVNDIKVVSTEFRAPYENVPKQAIVIQDIVIIQ